MGGFAAGFGGGADFDEPFGYGAGGWDFGCFCCLGRGVGLVGCRKGELKG